MATEEIETGLIDLACDTADSLSIYMRVCVK